MKSTLGHVQVIRREPRPFRYLLSRVLWRSGLCRLLTVQQEGYRIRFHPSSIAAALWLDPSVRAETPAFISAHLRAGEVAVDVGANIGTTALAAAVAVGPSGCVHAIEPHPRTYRFLADNVALNGLTNVATHNVAVGDGGGVIRVSDERWDDENRVTNGQGLEVPIRCLDEVIGPEPVHLLKIDVEGYELMVLRGAAKVLARTHCVYFEANDAMYRNYGYETADVFVLLRTAGFRIFADSTETHLQEVAVGAEPPTKNLIAARDPDDLARRLAKERRDPLTPTDT